MQLPANRVMYPHLMHELHQIATLGRGAVQVEHQLPPAAATGSQGLQGLQARRLQGVVHQIQHLLHIGAILAAATTTAVKTDGSLAVFTFRVKAAGDAKLTLADALLSDTDGKALPLSYSLPALVTPICDMSVKVLPISSGASAWGTWHCVQKYRRGDTSASICVSRPM